MSGSSFLGLVIVGMAAGLTSVTIGQSKVFKPLRGWVEREGNPWLLDLISCPFCLGHWIGLVFALASGVINPILWLTIIAMASLTSGAIGKLYGD